MLRVNKYNKTMYYTPHLKIPSFFCTNVWMTWDLQDHVQQITMWGN